jgi:large subunit ribosomal protein L7/L12
MAKLVSAGGTAEVRADGNSPPPQAKTTAEGHYGVKLDSFGTSKIQCIKVVRDATGLGLADAKKLVESAPVIVKHNLSKEAAQSLVTQLEQAGGKASALLASE